MPVINLVMFEGRSKEQKKNIIAQIKKSYNEAFKIEKDILHFRVNEYDHCDLVVPQICSDNYASIEVDMMPGKKQQEKELFFSFLGKNLQQMGIESNDIYIRIREPALENWSVRGKTGAEIRNNNRQNNV